MNAFFIPIFKESDGHSNAFWQEINLKMFLVQPINSFSGSTRAGKPINKAHFRLYHRLHS
jgi:hypothetical protein